ncbi:MAG: molybdenum cofactor biosynthesis protein MoaE [Rhodospirillaceae bacterium]|nr:molybdenum cofactor biosynthesis protein MoaE [Rhodospirillaceae bacterium]
MATIRVQREAFDPGAEINSFCARNSTSGGIATFIGQMRDFRGESRATGETVSAMTLEHYPGMAEGQLSELVKEASGRWPLDDTLVIHRIGSLMPGEPIVLAAVATAHRGDAFTACAFLMDWLKTRAPFWKKEATETGASWVEAREADEDQAAKWTR